MKKLRYLSDGETPHLPNSSADTPILTDAVSGAIWLLRELSHDWGLVPPPPLLPEAVPAVSPAKAGSLVQPSARMSVSCLSSCEPHKVVPLPSPPPHDRKSTLRHQGLLTMVVPDSVVPVFALTTACSSDVSSLPGLYVHYQSFQIWTRL